MRRRNFIQSITSVAVAWLFDAAAQETGRRYRVGFLYSTAKRAPHHLALLNELQRAGFVEGKNLIIDWGGFGLPAEQFLKHAKELVKAEADVIVCGGELATRAAQQATTTIPLLALSDDVVGEGLVHSLAKPGGNTTGVSIFATELDSKRQEILIETVPGIRRMAVLADSKTTRQPQLMALAEAARARGIELSIHQVSKSEEIVPAIDAAKTAAAAAINVLASPMLFINYQSIIAHVAILRLPAVYQWPEIAEHGGLIAYGPSIVQIYRELIAPELIQLLRGTKPADLPIVQPATFALVINLKTAKALDITIPQSLLLRADELVQ